VRTAILIAVVAGALAGQTSPDGKLYAVAEDGQKVGKGEEFARFFIFSADDKRLSVIHIWLTEPDGSPRVRIRGCESFGWIDSKKFYCQGTINPSTEVYRWFDAETGKELGEDIGSEFTWSPDFTTLAHFGNVPHFTPEEYKSDSIEVGGHAWPAEGVPDGEQHWFRSSLSWSPDSKFVAVVDHQRRLKKAFFLEIVEAKSGKRAEHKLELRDDDDEWPPDHRFQVLWSSDAVTVFLAQKSQSFPR
jgi:hypothetical protein